MTATETAAPAFRYLGTTDESVVCEKCGKADLRSTVMIVPLDADGNDDGDVTYYGSTCAARALGIRGGGKAVLAAANGARLRTLMNAHDARRMLRHYGNLPETGPLTEEQRRAGVHAYVRNNRGVQAEIAKHGGTVTDRLLEMLARKQAAIADAVLVAGAEWGKDPQPLSYGYRSAIADTME
jgi:coenzyme F420-reducing hydrogenase beta subunit